MSYKGQLNIRDGSEEELVEAHIKRETALRTEDEETAYLLPKVQVPDERSVMHTTSTNPSTSNTTVAASVTKRRAAARGLAGVEPA